MDGRDELCSTVPPDNHYFHIPKIGDRVHHRVQRFRAGSYGQSPHPSQFPQRRRAALPAFRSICRSISLSKAAPKAVASSQSRSSSLAADRGHSGLQRGSVSAISAKTSAIALALRSFRSDWIMASPSFRLLPSIGSTLTGSLLQGATWADHFVKSSAQFQSAGYWLSCGSCATLVGIVRSRSPLRL